ncbi:TPA: hypothetical protein N0F65_012073 [Lagenidium giganteum]|uniref:DUF7869 domain-containing protein n=1 Tax=Lagenidium giganteum TaxID=4803 RepID=A0AAV2YNT7_9STRA|nr:TPA: hypothetical protein N0F65_012073 [Lagenidium giganteum]
MRVSYRDDYATASDADVVLTMDYAQNVALPHVVETLAQCFLSLWSQSNYVYKERKAGKGPNKVISMLTHYLPLDGESDKSLTPCFFKNVDLKFFVRGHTKNTCDRGFGNLIRKLLRNDCWTLKELVKVLDSRSTDSKTILFEEDDAKVYDYKDALNELYKNLPAIQKYQMFSSSRDNPGVVSCRNSPDGTSHEYDLRRVHDGIRFDADRARQLFNEVKELAKPTLNAEKACDIHNKMLPYVPIEHHGNSLYTAPLAEQQALASTTKKSRRKSNSKGAQ